MTGSKHPLAHDGHLPADVYSIYVCPLSFYSVTSKKFLAINNGLNSNGSILMQHHNVLF